MNKIPTLALVLVAIGLGSVVVGIAYSAYTVRPLSYSNWSGQGQNHRGIMGQGYQQPQPQSNAPLTLEQAKTVAEQYLASMQNPNLALMEIMEFQNNFYVMYYEKNTGIGAFEMLIWKQTPTSGMMSGGFGMGRGMTGVIMPEPGPNMMWDTKYGMMNGGMMGTRNQASAMTITKEKALEIGQSYLNSNLDGAKVEDAMQFYGYYTIDYTMNGKISGMLSVNGYTGQVWYHSWHGVFIQEFEFA
jgi:hypothetical protein